MIELPSELETERLVVRKYRKGDGKEYLALFERNDNRSALKEFVDEAKEITTLEEAEIKIREHRAEWTSRKRFVMGIWLKSTGEFIGEIWIEPENWDVPTFELGYFLDSGYWNKGLTTEAALRSMEFIFHDLKAHKIIVITRDYNEKSYKLAEKLGFVKEGHFRESGFKDGRRWGQLRYGMLKREFEAMK